MLVGCGSLAPAPDVGHMRELVLLPNNTLSILGVVGRSAGHALAGYCSPGGRYRTGEREVGGGEGDFADGEGGEGGEGDFADETEGGGLGGEALLEQKATTAATSLYPQPHKPETTQK